MAVPIQQAAANALAAWLQTKFTDGTVVSNRWPEPDKQLPAKAVSIILIGQRQDEMIDPEVVSSVPGPGGTTLFTWKIRSCRQPVRLDCWSTYANRRDDILAQLDQYLNVGEQTTLGLTFGDPARNGLLLPLSDGWSGYVDFWFDSPSYFDTPQSNALKEYRAGYSGECAFDLYVTAASYKIAQIVLQQQLHEGLTPLASTGTDVATITAASTTYTHTTP